MAYDKLAEGNRPFDAVEDGDVDDRDINELMDQLKAMLGPNDYQIGLAGISGADWTEEEANDPPRISDSVGAGGILIIQLYPKQGMKIVEMNLMLGGLAAGTEANKGAIELVRCSIGDGTAAATVASFTPDDGNDVWARGGAGTHIENWPTINHTVAKDYTYHLKIKATGDGGGAECYFYGGVMNCQFGN